MGDGMRGVLRVGTVLLYAVAAVLVGREAWGRIAAVGQSSQGLRESPRARPALSATEFAHAVRAGNRLGPADANVVIVVYSNYQCSYCASFEKTLTALRMRYPDQLAVVVKHFEPTGSRVAKALEMAADCAAEQGKFGSYHQLAFSRDRGTVHREPWQAIGVGIGIPDSTRFATCVRSEQFATRVEAHTHEARRFGVDGTPTSFVNGVRVVGNASLEGMDGLVVAALRGKLRGAVTREEVETAHGTGSPLPAAP